METNIRLLEKKDITQVAKVFKEAFNKSEFGEEWTQNTAEEFINHWYKKQPDLFFIVTTNSKVIGGTVAEVIPWQSGSDLVDAELFVDPNFQKRNIGKELLKNLISEAINKYNINNFAGITTTKSDFLLNWYNKLKIKQTGLVHIEGNAKEILQNLK